MNIDPILQAPLAVQIHLFAAIPGFFLGIVVLWNKKGTRLHRRLGRIWVGLMVVVSVGSFFIHELLIWGEYSPIHILSVFTLGSLAVAIILVRNGNIAFHKLAMQSAFLGGLVIAGGFTFLPGRLMNKLVVVNFHGVWEMTQKITN